MHQQLRTALQPIRHRLRIARAVRWGVSGLLAGTVVGTGVALVRFLWGADVPFEAAFSLMFGMPLIAAFAGFFVQQSWRSAAAVVDAVYGLKDRTITALEFSRARQPTAIKQLQIDDAIHHLTAIDARRIVPLHLPDSFPYAVFAGILTLAVMLIPFSPPDVTAAFEQPVGIAMAAEQIEQEIVDLEQSAEQDEDLKPMVFDLRKQLEQMQAPNTDVRDALAAISIMQTKIAQQQAKYNSVLVDAQLQSLGEAMQSASEFREVGESLAQSEFELAAKALEKPGTVRLDASEAQAASVKLDQVASEMKNVELAELGDTVDRLSKASKNDDSRAIREASRTLAQSVRKHALRKDLSQSLAANLRRLGELKALCLSGGGGDGDADSNTISNKLSTEKSERGTTSAGLGSVDSLNGDKTELASQRQQKSIIGQLGDGQSEFETTTSADGVQRAQRSLQKTTYDEYRKLSDAVLDAEPIPLGHRQAIRRYFELIRPKKEDAAEVSGHRTLKN